MHTNNLPHILPLATLSPDLDLVGGKAASLARLTQAGLPVPDGFIVTTAMYRQFVTEFGLQTKILDRVKGANFSQPAALQGISADIQHQFQTTPIPIELARAIEQAYARLPGSTPPVAVRSSATAEDLPGASYAGQQESYLNIRGSEAVFQAVKQCWASLWTARAIAYRFQQGIAPEQVAQAVIVQLLVPADAAGILFTANPVTGDPHQLVISASWGLGEAIVGGRVTPDSILVDKLSRSILKRKTATKHIQTVLAEGGTAEQPVPQNLQQAPVLTDQAVLDLVMLGKQVEQLYQTPLDIEWALENGNFVLLQARPITALPEFVPDDDPFIWNDSQSGHYLWSNVNFGEAISRVMTPLTFSVIRFTLKDWEYIPGYPDRREYRRIPVSEYQYLYIAV
jgi:rifampicin phosphotransferase